MAAAVKLVAEEMHFEGTDTLNEAMADVIKAFFRRPLSLAPEKPNPLQLYITIVQQNER